MSQNYEYQLARAEDAAVEAKAASLDNVRERALRSEAAWRAMAERTRRVDKERTQANLERDQRHAEAFACAISSNL